jgi:uracil-DNA glycosylase
MTKVGDWDNFLDIESKKDYMIKLNEFIESEESLGKTIYPKLGDRFNAFRYTPFKIVKCCIIGQDPYHTPNKAMGLSFSIKKSEKLTPSIRNMYKELQDDLGIDPVSHGDISGWSRQGVLLLNTVLTVEKGKANSHKNKGWEKFTESVIEKINTDLDGVIFLLWGKESQKMEILIDQAKHHVLKTSHPTHFSARKGFFGSKCFSKTNSILLSSQREEINWKLDEV